MRGLAFPDDEVDLLDHFLSSRPPRPTAQSDRITDFEEAHSP
jgi:hypothetical protein